MRNNAGISLIELMVSLGVMGIMMLGMMTLHSEQARSNGFLEFQLKKIQLQNMLTGQVFSNPNNCACLFNNANPFVQNPNSVTLAGVRPTEIGRYRFVDPTLAPPALCGVNNASLPNPLVDSNGIDGIKATSIELRNIRVDGGSYFGEIFVTLQSTRALTGPLDAIAKIPVAITTTAPVGGMVNFVSCTSAGSAAPPPPPVACNPLDPAKPWVKSDLYCTVTRNSGSYKIGDLVAIRLSEISNGVVSYRHGGYNDDRPLGVRFDATTGAYVSSGSNNNLENGGLDCTDANADLKTLSQNAANANGC